MYQTSIKEPEPNGTFPADTSYQPSGSEPAAAPVVTYRAKPLLAYIIIGVNVLIFLLMTLSGVSLLEPLPGDLLDWGASYGPYVFNGDWWRLVTAIFVHIGPFHLILNMQAIWRVGGLAESLFGRGAFLILYLLSGIGGAIASLLLNTDIISAGASGAIFGLAGGLVILLWRGKLQLPQNVIRTTLTSMVLFVAYNLFYGLANEGIDNAAHMGGLVTGALIGVLVVGPLAEEDSRALGVRLVVCVCVVLALVPISISLNSSDPLAEALRAEELLVEGRIDEAITMLEDILEDNPDSDIAHFVLGNAYLYQNQYTKAITSYTQAVTLNEDNKAALYNRGLAYFLDGQYDKALGDFDRCIELDSDDAAAYLFRGLVHADMGHDDQAVSDIEQALSVGLNPDMEDIAESALDKLK